MQAALLVYHVVNARAVNICKWRYKTKENKDSIPAEYNRLCVDDPFRIGPNMASRPLKEIVSEAREALVEMAGYAQAFIDKYKDYCIDREVRRVTQSLDHTGPIYCSKFVWPGEYQEHITPPSYPEKFSRGCCKMKAPYNEINPIWYTGELAITTKLPFGLDEDNSMWAELVQQVEMSLQPPLPARPLTLHPVDILKPGKCKKQMPIRFPDFNDEEDWPLLSMYGRTNWAAWGVKEVWGMYYGTGIDEVVCARVCRRFGKSVCGQIKYGATSRDCWLMPEKDAPRNCTEAEESSDTTAGWLYIDVFH